MNLSSARRMDYPSESLFEILGLQYGTRFGGTCFISIVVTVFFLVVPFLFDRCILSETSISMRVVLALMRSLPKVTPSAPDRRAWKV